MQAPKIRLTQRRAMLNAARERSKERIKEKLQPVFKKQFKRIERFLRKGNLRKKLGNALPDVPFEKVHALFKDDSSPTSDKEQWDAWKKLLLATLLLALFETVFDFGVVENEVWTSRGLDPLEYDAESIIREYQLRTGRPLGEIGEKTLIAVELLIATWYSTDAPFSELIKSLERYFSQTRIETIASTETGNVLSQIVLTQMEMYGIYRWYWDAMGEDPCKKPLTISGVVWQGCTHLNGQLFQRGDPMPPDAAHPNCECLPTPDLSSRLEKGEAEGHPFRGNQYTDGESYSSLDPRSFSEEEILRAVHEYSSKGSVAVKLNHSLRNKKDLTQNLLSVKEPLEQAIRRSILDRNISVYRGEVLAEDKYEKELVERLSGDLFEDRGFLSTSYSEEKARFFSSIESRNSSVLYRIEALRGTPALDVSGKEYSSSSGEYEDEMLFLPNQKFRIKSSTTREKSSGGKLYIVDLVSVPLGEKNE